MNKKEYSGYRGYIISVGGEILLDSGFCCVVHYSYPEDTRYYVQCEFPVKAGVRETSCPEIWTGDEAEAKYLLDNPDKVVDWLRGRIKADPKLSRYADQPVIEKEHRLPNYGGDPQLLAKTPQYIIFRCHWPAHEYYELAAEYTPRGCHDCAPMWSCRITKEQADDLLAHHEKTGPLFGEMQKRYPYGD
ncbi:hypothetical protein [uncultured Ruminococcus sp.]|uniref:hypothetical protein n=1 Tax=uncultured Ruminococcus sp. TaxID=165186 RepID=UPI002606DE55|nr:hypothetical protein [uncultured Ruminococcus sp.]